MQFTSLSKIICFILLFTAELQAIERYEFVKTSDNVYQHSISPGDYSIQVILTRSGVFVSWQDSKNSIPLPEFHPKVLNDSNSQSIYFEYTDHYQRVTYNGRSWKLKGNVTFIDQEANLRFVIDSNNGFFTIDKSSQDQKYASILGLVRNKVVLNYSEHKSDSNLVSILRANSYPGIIDSYVLKNGQIQSGDKTIPDSRELGLEFSESKNRCVRNSDSVRFIPEDVHKKVLATKDSIEAKNLLKEAITHTENPIPNLIILSQTNAEVIGLDTTQSKIVRISNLKNTCVISEITI